MPRQLHFRIVGMTCGACAGRVERALRGVDGVSEAVVNLMNESASVRTSDDGPADDALTSAVRGVGYDAEVLIGGGPIADRLQAEGGQREILRRHRQTLIQVLMYGLPVPVLDLLIPTLWGQTEDRQVAGRLLQILLLVMLAATAGAPILLGGLRSLWHRAANMDLLISMGVFVAFASSLYGIFIARQNAFVHLNATAMILSLVCIGRYLEAGAKNRASRSMAALARRAPRRALVRRNDAWVSIAVADIAVGDVINVPTHETIPVDGEVTEGNATVDERLMTGEPMPVHRSRGAAVMGGTVVSEGMIVMKAMSVGRSSALGRIVQLVHEAQASRTRMQLLADRVAAVFAPVIIVAAGLVFVSWLVVRGTAGAAEAARSAVAVLVVACPCALGLATPTVVMVASGLAALRGILVRDAGMLEAMGQVNLVVWDKTGTLTAGVPAVERFRAFGDWDEDTCGSLAAGAEMFSNHPLAKAIVAHARRAGLAAIEPTSFDSIPGSGVKATVDGRSLIVGKPSFLKACSVDIEPLSSSGELAKGVVNTVVAMAIDGRVAGIFALSDAVRPSSRDAVARLGRMGIVSEMLTGDSAPTALAIAEQLGIPKERVVAGVDPGGKAARIQALKEEGFRVAMVGDGVNDAAALAIADVGIAFATGADVAGEAAGINLVGSTPHLVADAVALARFSVQIIRQNLFWAFFYNLLMIPLAAAGYVHPALAAGAMMASSLTVIANALRLGRLVRSNNAASVVALPEGAGV